MFFVYHVVVAVVPSPSLSIYRCIQPSSHQWHCFLLENIIALYYENCSVCSLCWDINFVLKISFSKKLIDTEVVGDLVICAVQKNHDFISSGLGDIKF